jgi:hypothetical protein
MKILILHTAPLEQVAYCIEKITEEYKGADIACVCSEDSFQVFAKELKIRDLIAFNKKFFKVYNIWGLLKKIKKGKYEVIALFYNNMARKGYGHIEITCFLSGIRNIIIGDHNGAIETLPRGRFFTKIILAKYLNCLGNIVTFLGICVGLLIAYMVYGIRYTVYGLREKK